MNEKEHKLNFKQEAKELWDAVKAPVKAGCFCLVFGAFYGFVKGMNAQGKLTGDAMMALIDKIPQLPEPDDIPIEEILAGCDKDEVMEIMGWK